MSVQRMLAEPLRTPRRLRLAVRFRRPANRSASIALVVVAAYVFMAVFGGLLAPFSPVDFNMAAVLKPPSWGHPFGTDGFGRDVLSRVLTGARSILVLACLATTFGVATGSALGLVSGYRGGLVDEALMRLVDILLALPGLLLALLILTSLGSSPTNLVIAIAIVFVPKSARVARSAIAPLRRLGYVEAARLRGTRWLSIVFRELLPNVRGELAVEFCLRFAYALLLISSLGFLGFGVQPPAPDWGLMISEARGLVMIAPWIVLFPALAIGFIVVAVNVLADGLGAKGSKHEARYL
jgi:peptide/nickel transport system permease protein